MENPSMHTWSPTNLNNTDFKLFCLDSKQKKNRSKPFPASMTAFSLAIGY